MLGTRETLLKKEEAPTTAPPIDARDGFYAGMGSPLPSKERGEGEGLEQVRQARKTPHLCRLPFTR